MRDIRWPGDTKYGDREANQRFRALGLKRLFLHAAHFEFELGGKAYGFSAPLPAEPGAACWTRCRARSRRTAALTPSQPQQGFHARGADEVVHRQSVHVVRRPQHLAMAIAGLQVRMVVLAVGHEPDRVDEAQRVAEIRER